MPSSSTSLPRKEPMRSNPMARIIIGAAALTLLVSSAVGAQSATPPPKEFGPDLQTSVVTNALDDARTNELIESTARAFHLELGGKAAGKFWRPEPPQPGSDGVVQALLRIAKEPPSVAIVSGGDGQATVGIARNSDATVFIDLGQGLPCVTEDGQPDPSGTCAGGEAGIPFNYTAVDFAVEDGAYLAGLLAAAASRNDRIGIISGAAECSECNRYIRGFVNGARSVKPGIAIQLAYLADDETAGFSDRASAQTFTRAFLDVYQPDVLLPVGRGTSRAMIETVCEAGDALAVGTGIDVAASDPDLAQCVLTSVSKDVASAVRETMYAFAQGTTSRTVSYGLTDGRVSVTWPKQSWLPVDTAERYKRAETAILTGQIDTCPGDCGARLDGAVEDEAGVESGGADTEAAEPGDEEPDDEEPGDGAEADDEVEADATE
jgi:basic membrane lipoprotein Med (substrate-binding protein (PBP1-ABC) superfamily)